MHDHLSTAYIIHFFNMKEIRIIKSLKEMLFHHSVNDNHATYITSQIRIQLHMQLTFVLRNLFYHGFSLCAILFIIDIIYY